MIHRFYVDTFLKSDLALKLPKKICSHIHVLRLRSEEIIQLFNGNGYNYNARINFIDRNDINAQIYTKTHANNESNLKIILIQCFSTSQKMDFIIQKAVELGVNEIYPVISSRTNAKFNSEKNKNKQQRWNEIIQATCEQSGRAIIPLLHPISELTTILKSIKYQHKLIFHTQTVLDKPRPFLKKNNPIVIAIGPEGGFSEQEVIQAKKNNFIQYSLGPRILRTETAPIAAIASLQTRYGDFN